MDRSLLSLLACPKCKMGLKFTDGEKGLLCESCRVIYPIREGVPVMLQEEALPVQAGATGSEVAHRMSGEKARFLIVDGQSKGEKIDLTKGTCRALGRSLDDVERTKIHSVDTALSLDESSKKVVMQYLNRQFQRSDMGSKKSVPAGEETLGGFIRDRDVRLKDTAVSRLHAMLFYDESGVVGILDLVSKNGTFVNGGEVESKILKPGDLIAIGSTKIRFEA